MQAALAVPGVSEQVEESNDKVLDKLKKKIRELKSEEERKEDYKRRLEGKLQKQEKKLADEVEDVESKQRQLSLEKNKHKDEVQSQKRETDAKAANQEKRILDHLVEVLYAKPANKPNSKGNIELDTVQVSFMTGAGKKHCRYNLAFRIEETTTVARLKGIVCKYWNKDSERYVLKTMADSKCADGICVYQCFKQGEIAQLKLEEKQESKESEPKEADLKAIAPKTRKTAEKANKRMDNFREGVASLKNFQDNYSSQLKDLTGIYFLLKLRDRKPSEHASKIKLRDIVIYGFLAVTSFWVYTSRRQSGVAFYQREGLESAFLAKSSRKYSPPDAYTTEVPPFTEIHHVGDVWNWLEITLPEILWDDSNSSVSHFNLLLGYFSIRTQSVREPTDRTSRCDYNEGIVTQLPGASCYAVFLGDDERTEPYPEIERYPGSGLQHAAFRGPEDPTIWRSAEYNYDQHSIGDIRGSLDTYKASGYSATFRMDVENNTYAKDVYNFDMAKLKEAGWISPRTRSVIVSFSAYNFVYDRWIAAYFGFEIPPGGSVSSFHNMLVFSPRIDETRKELTETYIDYVRVIVALYILVIVGYVERAHKTKYHKAGAWYHILLTGLTDFGIVTCIIIIATWSWMDFGKVFKDPTGMILTDIAQTADKAASKGFISLTDWAWKYDSLFCIEGLLMVFISLRMVTFFRLNHHVYMMWHSLGRAFISFGFFILMFVPIIVGFIFILHRIFGYHLEEYSLLRLSALQVLLTISGEADVSDLARVDSFMALVFLVLFYFFVTFGLMNVFLTTVVDAYYIVQLTEGGPGEKWTWARFYKWALPSLAVQAIVPQGQQIG